MSTLSDAQRRMLAAPLPRDVVKRLPGKTGGDYVTGYYVIDRLNDVFGVDGWTVTYGDPTVREGERPVVYVVTTLTAAGVTRTDIGMGVAANSTPDAFETAFKSAYTDGIKRCARFWGASFGLALYDKDRREVGYSTTALDLLSALAEVADVDAWVAEKLATFEKLDRDERDELRGACARRRRELRAVAPVVTPPAPVTTAAASAPAASVVPEERAPDADPLAPVEERIAQCTSLDELVAVGIAAASVVPEERAPDAKRWLGARAVALGETKEVFGTRYGAGKRVTTEAQPWADVAAVLRGLALAPDVAAVANVVRAHVAAYGRLAKPLQDIVSGAASTRRRALGAPAVSDPTDELLAAAGRATNAAELKAVGARMEACAQARTITRAQAESVAEALNERVAYLTQKTTVAA